MNKCASAPLLSRVKPWQLIGLGISGWCTLYSIAIVTWGASSTLIGNTQGGCFAVTMTLASFEAKRYRKAAPDSVDTLQWASGVPTEHLNQTLANMLNKSELRVETCKSIEAEMGFGVRAVNAGRTMVFETGRWKELVIDLGHVQTTEENRKMVHADLAIIVSAGNPDESAKNFAEARPINFLIGQELKNLLKAEMPSVKKA